MRTLHVWVVFSLIGVASIPAAAHIRGMYATRAEAAQRAAELQCECIHQCECTHRLGDRWMPCADEQALHRALRHQ